MEISEIKPEEPDHTDDEPRQSKWSAVETHFLNPTFMNASEILTKFENMVGDSLDQDFEMELANDAMHEIEEDVKPEGLKAETRLRRPRPARPT